MQTSNTQAAKSLKGTFTLSLAVGQVENDAAFKGFGHLLFVADKDVSSAMTLSVSFVIQSMQKIFFKVE
jgi:hypothetical protein